MGLLNSYTSYNRVISQDKVVRYSRVRVRGEWTYLAAMNVTATLEYAYEYHRICSKQYSYVGMDLTTAKACAEAMITKYTRATKDSVWNSSGTTAGTFTDSDGGLVVTADVAIVHDSGCMYSVQISVHEDDSRMRVGVLAPSVLFTAEDARDYDEDED